MGLCAFSYSLWLYYMRALAHAHAEMVTLLREQLIMVSALFNSDSHSTNHKQVLA